MDPPNKKQTVASPRPPPPAAKAEKPTTLLDVYEVEWITRELDRLLVKGGGGGDAGADGHHHRKKARVAPPPPQPHKKAGFVMDLLGKRAVAICGESMVVGGRRRGRTGQWKVEKV